MSTTTSDSSTQTLESLGPCVKHSENPVNCIAFIRNDEARVFPPYRLRFVTLDSCKTRIAEHGGPEFAVLEFDLGSVRLRGWRLGALIEAVFAGTVSEVCAVSRSVAEEYPELPVVTEIEF